MKPFVFSGLLCLSLSLIGLPVYTQSYYQPPSSNHDVAAFGRAVAIGEGVIYISEAQGFRYPGRVHLFQPSATGTWEATTHVAASDGAVGDQFGRSLALAERTLLVGARPAEAAGGAVYVFQREGASASWREAARLVASDGGARDNFGSTVALTGDQALVSANGHNERAGAVYVYQRNATSGVWAATGKFVGSGVEAGDRFGTTLAVEDGWALVGAPAHQQGAGAVYVFRLDAATGVWQEHSKLTGEGNTRLGSSVQIGGGVAFAGARLDNLGGRVHVFQYEPASGEWREQSTLQAGERNLFGAPLQLEGDVLWVGARGASGFRGALYRFERSAEGRWGQAQPLANDEGQGGDVFAGAFAIREDLAVVGAAGADYGEGTARILRRDAAGQWTEEAVVFNEGEPLESVLGEQVDCTDGEAGSFPCDGIDLISFLPLEALGAARGVRLNDVWGWTDPLTDKEYALAGHMEGTVFIDVTNPLNPVYLGELPRTQGTPGSTWRDIKVYKDHAFIVADGAGAHGLQVFDLTRLRDVQQPPVVFGETAHYNRIHSAHNIVINETTGFGYIVGSSSGGETCGGGLHIINLQEPLNPTFAGCFADPTTGQSRTGYSHDAHCIVYNGPDVQYQGKEICIGSNETAISISDVTDKENPVPISSGSYPNYGYVHQGWLTEDHRYFYQNDETDELGGKVDRTRTLIWDVTDLDDPVLMREYFGPTSATDHNIYIRGNLMYQTNNASGLRILDISDPKNPREVGHFDTTPYGEDVPGFNGTWSSYPFFKSGMIVVTSRREGFFILKKRDVDI